MHTNFLFKLLSVMVIIVLSLSACGMISDSIVKVGDLRVTTTNPEPGQTVSIYIDNVEANVDVNFKWSADQGEIVSGQGTSSIQYQAPYESSTSLITVIVSAPGFYKEMKATVTVIGIPLPSPTPLPPLSCASPMLEAPLSPYNGEIPTASGRVQYCQSPDGNFVARIELERMTPNGSYVFTLHAADGDEQTNLLLAQICPNNQTSNGDYYCDFTLNSADSAGNLQSQFPVALPLGNYSFKFFLKDIDKRYLAVMNNDSVPSITITESLGTVSTSSGFQEGMTYVSWQAGQFNSSNADQALEELAATGANWIALVVTGYQDNVDSKEISIVDPKAPTDEDVQHVINKAKELGLSVMLKPHIDLKDGAWRGDIGKNFDNAAWSIWFTAYRDFVVHYAELASQNQDIVKILCVGTELKTTSSREADWQQIVQEVREVYSGKLVYASNWNGEDQRGWWKELDYIGVDAYFPLVPDNDSPSVEELKAAWQGPVKQLEDLHNQLGIPVILTELGYRSVKGAHAAPWEYQENMEVDSNEQANLYQAALDTFLEKNWIVGMYWWNWLADPNQGGAQDTDYTPHGKPAEDVVKEYYLTIPAPLASFSGPTACPAEPGASGEVLFSKAAKGVFRATVTLSNLKPKHVYVFTLNCKDNDFNCSILLASLSNCNAAFGGYCDIPKLGATDATGSLKKNINFALPVGQYDMKFFIKDLSADSCNLLFNDNPGSFTILNP